jgi:hypothetical protein
MVAPPSLPRQRAAWAVALLVDALQLATAPAELAGPVAWLLEGGLDLGAMAVLWALVGFHWAFLPSFVTKLIPFVDLAPTWTLAMLVATRRHSEYPPSGGAT